MGYMASLLEHQWMVHEPANPSNLGHLLGGRFLPSAHDFPFGDGQFPDVASWADSAPAERYFDAIFSTFCDEDTSSTVTIKDPTFLSSAEWLVQTYGVGKALVMIRHPAAVVASWKALGWENGNVVQLAHLYTAMMTEHVLPLWARYGGEGGMIRSMRGQQPDKEGCGRRWLFLRHEDFCADPVGVAIQLQEAIAMPEPLGPATLRELVARISTYTYAPDEAKGRHRYHSVHMDTASQLGVWKAELSPFEVEIVRTGTESVWPLFYTPEDWR